MDERTRSVLIDPSEPIGAALRRMDATGSGIVLVVAEDGKLLGVATDGDMRRWIIAGLRYAPEDRAERVALIQTLSRPAIHYKVLAAGRIPPAEALADAARNMRPGDAVCVGIHTGDKPDMLREDLEILMAEWVTA